VITAEEAALRAELILEYPADHPEHGWELDEFPQGWLINRRGWQGHPGQFSVVIERETGLARYFLTVMPQRIVNEYEAVRERGHLDDRGRVGVAPAKSSHPVLPDGPGVVSQS
jgi:hypothetical protein